MNFLFNNIKYNINGNNNNIQENNNNKNTKLIMFGIVFFVFICLFLRGHITFEQLSSILFHHNIIGP